jgi:RNA polymerase sigma factor (sigma-70 family)
MAVSPEATHASERVDELYRAHRQGIYRYALATLSNPADAEDVTQTTFMNALRALERGEQPRNPEGWLIAIAHNLVRERYRKARARPLEVALEPEAVGARQEDDQTKPSVDDIVRAMAGIPESQRSALVLREFEGRSYAEIARTLDMTTSALETLLFRARRSLAEELENLMTCARAEADLAQLRTGGLPRKERRRLEEHLKTCAACARLSASRPRRVRALGRALLLVPFPVRLFGGGHSAGGGSASALSGATTAGSSGAASTGGSVVLGGFAAKVAAVVATTAVASGVGYASVTQLTKHASPSRASHRGPQATARVRAPSTRGLGGSPSVDARTANASRPLGTVPAIMRRQSRGSVSPPSPAARETATLAGLGSPAATGTSSPSDVAGSSAAGSSPSAGRDGAPNAPSKSSGRSTAQGANSETTKGKSATAGSNGQAKTNGKASGGGTTDASGSPNGGGQASSGGQSNGNGAANGNGQASGSTKSSSAPANGSGSGAATSQPATPPGNGQADTGQASQGGSNGADSSNRHGKAKESDKP